MNELPQVLQKEIWEYVRGDRVFWKSQYELVVDLLEHMIDGVDITPLKFQANTRSEALMRYARDATCLRLSDGRRVRRFRRYLSTLNIPLYIDEDSEQRTSHWNKWRSWLLNVDKVMRRRR
jgi:hypothetical protein